MLQYLLMLLSTGEHQGNGKVENAGTGEQIKKTKLYVIFLDNELFTGILCSSEKVVCVVEDTK